jgi:hypothetical protein
MGPNTLLRTSLQAAPDGRSVRRVEVGLQGEEEVLLEQVEQKLLRGASSYENIIFMV